MGWGDFTWGSCQYDTAADFYKEIVGTKRTIGGKLAKKGITASWTRVRTWDEIKKLALKYFEKEYFTNPFWVGPNGCWTQKEVDKKRKKLEASNNVDELFEVCKSQSWDLWTAAPCIAKWAFVGLKLHNVPKPEDVRGPILNQLVQGTNNVTAVYCALLHAYFDVKEDAFSGFDT